QKILGPSLGLTFWPSAKSWEEKSLAGATIRRKLAALASLFENLCESNAVTPGPLVFRAISDGTQS
ncbi:MAG: hypothetical protein ABJA60_11505, partial [Nitrosospira sp.]